VATKIVGQNNSGLIFSNPNMTGSEPMGTKVAEINDITNTADKPYSGKEKVVKSEVNHSCMQAV
jgi:hypothetical protein